MRLHVHTESLSNVARIAAIDASFSAVRVAISCSVENLQFLYWVLLWKRGVFAGAATSGKVGDCMADEWREEKTKPYSTVALVGTYTVRFQHYGTRSRTWNGDAPK